MKKPTMTIAEVIHIKGKKIRMSPLDVRRSISESFSMIKMLAKLWRIARVNRTNAETKSPFRITLRIATGDRSIKKRAAAENMPKIAELISAIELRKTRADSALMGFPKIWKLVPIVNPIKERTIISWLFFSNSFLAFSFKVFFSGISIDRS